MASEEEIKLLAETDEGIKQVQEYIQFLLNDIEMHKSEIKHLKEVIQELRSSR